MPDDVRKIAAIAEEIGPDRIHLNTVVRPPAEDFATALSKKQMEVLVNLFQPTAEIIAEFRAKYANNMQVNQKTIFSMLQRRPCTADQIADIFGMHLNEVSKYLGKLIQTDQISTERKNNTVYYAVKKRGDKGYTHA